MEQQRLVFSSASLEDEKTLEHYGIHSESTVMMIIRLKGCATMLYHMDTSLLDPRFDYDFSGMIDDGTKLMRRISIL